MDFLRYGYYASYQMVLGPSSSRLVDANPIFIKQIQFKEEAKKGVFIYGFDQRPELRLESNWFVSKYMIIGSYSHQGFSMWLNTGSKIHLKWEAPSKSLDNLQIAIIKGERDFATLSPSSSASTEANSSKQLGGEQADYYILEDDKYYVSVVNMNRLSVIMTMNVNVSSKMYDTSNATSVCSTMSGSCKLDLLFPSTKFVILTTPNNYLGACNGEDDTMGFGTSTTHEVFVPRRVEQSESDPLMPEKPVGFTYGTGDEDQETGSSNGSSNELYDGKICVICYDEERNCFFVPCGHCATCYDCAQRIIEGESRVCPICRRLIHKVRKLFTS
ncbi:hypothetical protein V2J09_007111 [Rumex salicifolius]